MKLNSSRLRMQLARGMLLASLGTLSVHADYQSTILSQGPAGYWQLNETAQPPSNATVTNVGSLGTSADGTYDNSPTHQLTGPFAGSLAVGLDGVSQHITTPYQAALGTTSPFTVEVWANPSLVPKFAYLCSSVHLAGNRSGWYMAQDDGSTFGAGSAFVVRMFYQNAANPAITLAAPVSVANVWYHITLTWDGTTASLYTNGVVAASGVPLGYVGNIDLPFTVGCRSDGGFPWPGKVAEVAMYNTAFTPAKVAAHYSTALGTPANYPATVLSDSPVLYHRYREGSDVVGVNLGTAGAAGNTKYQVGTTPGVTGARPAAYPGFGAGNVAVSVPGTGPSVVVPALNFNTNTVTISGWIKSASSENAGSGIIVCDSGTTYAGITTDVVFGGLGLGYVWNNDPGSYNWSPTSDSGLPALPDSDWAYVALVVQPTQAAIFVCASNNPAGFAGVTNFLTHVNQAFAGSTLFGSDGGNPSYSFAGNIDEVAMFNRALGVGELYTQYGAAVGGLAPKVFNNPSTPVDTVYTGDSFTLTVDAGGTPNIGYQWSKSGGPIAGATASAFTKVNAQISDSDNYSCTITNAFGSAASASASVTVVPAFAPVINVQPQGHTLYPGGTIQLSVGAVGGGLRYQWTKNSAPIAGATNSAFSVASVVSTNAGSYSVTITNTLGTAVGGPVTITVLSPANSYETAIVADKPEAWYRLNETSGTSMFDSMGRHDGVYTNASGSPVTFGAAGAVSGSSDKAVSFDGTSLSYGIVPFSAKLNSQTFSIECWAKTSDTTGTRVPVSSRSAVPQGYWIWTVPAGSWSGGVNSAGNNYYVPSATADDGIVAGVWKHVVMVYDTSLKVYVNGQFDGLGYVDFERNAGSPFIIGARGTGTSVDDLFQGQVDEVLVYTNALTLAQAQNHYSAAVFPNPIPPFFTVLPASQEVKSNAIATATLNGLANGPIPISYQWLKNGVAIAGATNSSLTLACSYTNAASYVLRATNPNGSTNSPAATFSVLPGNPAYVNVTNGLVLHLKFDGNYQDSSGRGNNATAAGLNATPSVVAGKIGSGALHYENHTVAEIPSNIDPNPVITSNSFLTLGNPADLQFGSAVNFSVAYWVRLPVGYLNGDLPILCSAQNSYGNPGFTFAPGYTNGSWSFSYNGVCQVYGAAASINDGNWHHLLHTVDRNGYAVSYLDGVQADSRLATGIGNMNTAGPINIGQDPTAGYLEPGSADVDDMAVWRRSLSAYEAYSVYYAATNSSSSFDVPGTTSLKISSVGTNVVVSWTPGATLGTLLQSTNVTGPWTAAGAFTPVFTVPASGVSKFYRLSFTE